MEKMFLKVKEIVDSFDYPGLLRIKFELFWNDKWGYYEIVPTFVMDYWRISHSERKNQEMLLNVLKHSLSDRIESYLGIHVISPNASLVLN